ncbi:MAG: roadblock/LC7 domain-containing protein [Gemmatimonadetes bacterium]|nr:roadblock/LC7 domain-containing protein [Gemmatimonadota bacterium]
MPNIRELVAAISQREGVDAAVVLGRDGIVIDSSAPPDIDTERLAAHIPSILSGADDLGASAMRGPLTMAVIEQPGGLALVCALSAEAVLLVLVRPEANVASLLYELRRNREQMAALV